MEYPNDISISNSLLKSETKLAKIISSFSTIGEMFFLVISEKSITSFLPLINENSPGAIISWNASKILCVVFFAFSIPNDFSIS